MHQATSDENNKPFELSGLDQDLRWSLENNGHASKLLNEVFKTHLPLT